eukprot:5765982-Pyramimonas_sp.AAC.4
MVNAVVMWSIMSSGLHSVLLPVWISVSRRGGVTGRAVSCCLACPFYERDALLVLLALPFPSASPFWPSKGLCGVAL